MNQKPVTAADAFEIMTAGGTQKPITAQDAEHLLFGNAQKSRAGAAGATQGGGEGVYTSPALCGLS